jgi:glycosyltransferase involved in cell wall biosynthesis
VSALPLAAAPQPEPATRLKVVLVAHDVHDGGGMERACAELVRHSHREVDFTVISCTLARDLRDIVTWHRIAAPARPFLLKYAVFAVRAGARLRQIHEGTRHAVGAIVPNRIDVAAIHFCHAGFIAATGHLAPPDMPLVRRLNTAATRVVSLVAERWCYRPSRVHALAAVSAGIARELHRFYPRVPVTVTPNGISHPAAAPAPRPADRVVALFVGGDWERKGLGMAIDGLALAVDRGADLELWVVGGGDERRFSRLAERAGVASRVHFFGFREAADPYYAAADMFVLPTAYEAHPLVPHEAAAAGLPIVVTRVNGVDELVGDNEAGVLVERDRHAVGAALARLALDPDLREQLGRAARARTRGLTWRRSSEQMVSLYRRLEGSRE